MEIKYHLDESVANAIANGLQHRGIDVTTSKAVGLIGASDPEQLDYARRDGRVLVTHDDDFLRIHATGSEHAGIAYAQQKEIQTSCLSGVNWIAYKAHTREWIPHNLL
jgi:predicted nuclease of predicted toxin-antitoxin system